MTDVNTSQDSYAETAQPTVAVDVAAQTPVQAPVDVATQAPVETPVEVTVTLPGSVADPRKPKLRFTALGLLFSKTFWFNIIMTLVATTTELTESVRTILGDHMTGYLILAAGLVNIFLRVKTTQELAAKTAAGREDIAAAKQGQ